MAVQLPLLHPGIRQLAGLTIIGQTQVGHYKPWRVNDSGGAVWYAKVMRPNSIFAEAIWFELGRVVGAAQPDGAVGQVEGKPAWLSREVPLATHWNEQAPPLVANVAAVGAAVAVDALTGNEDRHNENILLQRLDSLRYQVYFIDAERIPAGQPAKYAEWGGTRPPDPSGLPHAAGLPISQLAVGAREAAGRFAALSPRDVDSIVDACITASGALGGFRPDVGVFVALRCQHAVQLTEAYLARLEKL